MKRQPWAPWELEFLRRNYACSCTADLAKVLERSLGSVYRTASQLGLAKSSEVVAAMARERSLRDGHGWRQHQFAKGFVPWNKGLHTFAGGRSAETRFKPGRPAHEARNYVPIGTLRIGRDGYLERKVTDDPALAPVRRWVGVHRLVWEAAHGPIPAGHHCAFLPGRRTADLALITADGLELVTRAEMMRRNTIHRMPAELADLARLRGQLTRAITTRTKEAP